MTRVIGIAIGIGILFLSFLAFQTSSTGWSTGHSDMGFWWGVIATFLAIAGLGAVVGTFIHTRPQAT